MAKPSPQKDIKMKNEDEKSSPNSMSALIINIVTTTVICAIFTGIVYKMTSDISATQKALLAQNTEEPEEEAEAVQKGAIIDLGEFTMNLADTTPKSYLKASVAIEVTTLETDPMNQPQETGGGGHGHGSAPAADPKELFEQQMAQYKPAIRDSIITVLSSKTSDELATTTGKELAKEQITEQINAIFSGEREVLRVSFGQFIMQQGR